MEGQVARTRSWNFHSDPLSALCQSSMLTHFSQANSERILAGLVRSLAQSLKHLFQD